MICDNHWLTLQATSWTDHLLLRFPAWQAQTGCWAVRGSFQTDMDTMDRAVESARGPREEDVRIVHLTPWSIPLN